MTPRRPFSEGKGKGKYSDHLDVKSKKRSHHQKLHFEGFPTTIRIQESEFRPQNYDKMNIGVNTSRKIQKHHLTHHGATCLVSHCPSYAMAPHHGMRWAISHCLVGTQAPHHGVLDDLVWPIFTLIDFLSIFTAYGKIVTKNKRS